MKIIKILLRIKWENITTIILTPFLIAIILKEGLKYNFDTEITMALFLLYVIIGALNYLFIFYSRRDLKEEISNE